MYSYSACRSSRQTYHEMANENFHLFFSSGCNFCHLSHSIFSLLLLYFVKRITKHLHRDKRPNGKRTRRGGEHEATGLLESSIIRKMHKRKARKKFSNMFLAVSIYFLPDSLFGRLFTIFLFLFFFLLFL